MKYEFIRSKGLLINSLLLGIFYFGISIFLFYVNIFYTFCTLTASVLHLIASFWGFSTPAAIIIDKKYLYIKMALFNQKKILLSDINEVVIPDGTYVKIISRNIPDIKISLRQIDFSNREDFIDTMIKINGVNNKE